MPTLPADGVRAAAPCGCGCRRAARLAAGQRDGGLCGHQRTVPKHAAQRGRELRRRGAAELQRRERSAAPPPRQRGSRRPCTPTTATPSPSRRSAVGPRRDAGPCQSRRSRRASARPSGSRGAAAGIPGEVDVLVGAPGLRAKPTHELSDHAALTLSGVELPKLAASWPSTKPIITPRPLPGPVRSKVLRTGPASLAAWPGQPFSRQNGVR